MSFAQSYRLVRGSLRLSSRFVCCRCYSVVHQKTIYSGIQPTGFPHLGNYLGALKQWLHLQQTEPADTRIILSLVDLHAITQPVPAAQLKAWKKEMLAVLLAIGLDPARCIIYEQSRVREHTELAWILSTMAPMGALSRMTQWKVKAKTEADTMDDLPATGGPNLGLFAYPVLQAADILLYKTTGVPVGHDQAQHIELCRDLAKAFNSRTRTNTLLLPRTMMPSAGARVQDLRDPSKKMSKSAKNAKSRILLIDTEETIISKIASAVTDSELGVTYEPKKRPGVANLLDLAAAFNTDGRTAQDLAKDWKDLTHKQVKGQIAKSLNTGITPIRERFYELTQCSSGQQRLDAVAEEGAEKARVIAAETMVVVREKMGLH
ncbi:tryptophanyl-tRNA synthetase [Protomyces lactucae-debilis]|uniref:tryptophan--tRNA ligase n=1 Tax=Protomyces lactucae-debilis TaxID=2754530 RepID=A0A1Y2FS50_PROLT|nr:tryptophanyl-tRNA synthetase [Protomyces lactucae-debilis]ORY86831.1 tryptophanyl-tRNA synthetase [Protomyces lactucae-debilis]